MYNFPTYLLSAKQSEQGPDKMSTEQAMPIHSMCRSKSRLHCAVWSWPALARKKKKLLLLSVCWLRSFMNLAEIDTKKLFCGLNPLPNNPDFILTTWNRNIVERRNAGYQHFLLFLNVFLPFKAILSFVIWYVAWVLSSLTIKLCYLVVLFFEWKNKILHRR